MSMLKTGASVEDVRTLIRGDASDAYRQEVLRAFFPVSDPCAPLCRRIRRPAIHNPGTIRTFGIEWP